MSTNSVLSSWNRMREPSGVSVSKATWARRFSSSQCSSSRATVVLPTPPFRAPTMSQVRLTHRLPAAASVLFQPVQQQPSDGRLADAALLGADDEQGRLDHRAGGGGGARGVA